MAESFGGMLKRHRVAAGLSQETLAERAGVSVDAISYLERDARHAPQKATLDLLIAALSLDEDSRRQIEGAARLGRSRGPRSERHASLRNLPRTVTRLIGRARDVDSVLDLLERYPLVTITGAGGVGKTRVALEVAQRYAERKSCEVAFVDLSPLTDGSLVVDAVATAVGAPQSKDSGKTDDLLRYIRDTRSLLIFDNCEHILDGVATLAGEILQTCPSVTLLTTTRERLDIGGEALFRLPSLSFPSHERAAVESPSSYSALELFVERANAVDSRFSFTGESSNLIADVCRRLEGIPLAIELAAARLPVFGLTTLQSRVSEHFILTGAGRGVPRRQATMQATIAWSYDLLHDAQRTLLNRLAIFAGGFTLEAAELVCPDEQMHVSEVVNLLASLVDKSLVNASFDHETTRYTLLESVRAYALEQLAATDSLDTLSRRHALWLVRKSEELLQTRIYEPFLPELANIRAALQWAVSSEDEQDTIVAARIAGGFRHVWLGTSRLAEYRFWSESLINRIDAQLYPEAVANLLAGLTQASEGAAKMAAVQRAIPLFEALGDYTVLAHLHCILCQCLRMQGQFQQAEKAAAESVRISETHGLERSDAFVHGLGELAQVAIMRQRTNEARAHVTRALEIILPSPLDCRWRTWLIEKLAIIEFCEGDTQRALELTEDALRAYPAVTEASRVRGGIRASLSIYHLLLNHLDAAAAVAHDVLKESHESDSPFWGIRCLAAIAALRGNAVAAARALGFSDEWFTRTGRHTAGPHAQAAYDVLVRALQERLADTAIDRLKAEGRGMTLDQVIDGITGVTEAPAS